MDRGYATASVISMRVAVGLLLVLGVMNLAWIALLAAFVLIEKLANSGPWLSRASGVLLLGWGVWMAGSAFLN